MKPIISAMVLCLTLVACNEGGGNGSNGGTVGGQGNKGTVTDWQASLLGQEGHGGDAVVCFSIPVDRALYQQKVGEENECLPGNPCQDGGSTNGPSKPGSGSGTVWRMTDEGRKSIRSAKPLEQYLAERITSKKKIIDQLNQLSVEDGYRELLQPFTKLPTPFKRIAETHQKLGWLDEDGIASEYGLLDINDSGFISENEIDKTYCKELQAVVRRDNQLWYDADIVKYFDNAGKVLIQLHEEIYAWGKAQDQINWEIPGQPAHETSTKTRRLILKIIDENIDQALVNENLKALGFSTMYWENLFKVPTSVGYYMDTDTCFTEQQFLKNFFKGGGYGSDFWLKVENLFSNRYLKATQAWPRTQMRHNFPDALSNMISLMLNGNTSTFATEIMQLQTVFERPESCEGRF